MKNKSQMITIILMSIYLVILIWLIIFKFQLNLSKLPQLREINLIPLASSVIANGEVLYREIYQNLLIFIPFGVYISILYPNKSFFLKVLPIFCTSLLFELIQFIFAIGASDITDLISNTLGGFIGCLLFLLLQLFFKEKTNKIINVVSIIATICIVLFMSTIFIANING